ncbi:IS21-like element helper ATPase IstB [Sulfobacillus thermosulfidooxidans]|uniref:IS21-like element helper ATPase IstB n=1 Tax=Sulfobacillus thermosulfidooxidans TaxID=28034 RepID=UPI000B08BD44|nr:IS21-like element helper ATPase IstB [Sulfobacillus thermosulfidooxidans]
MTRSTLTVPVDPCDDLAALCERLKLPEVGRLAAARAQQAAAEQWTYSQYLIDVFRAEVAARQARYVVSHTQMSHLPFHKTLDQYDFTFQPSLDERQVRQLLTLQWVDAAENLIVLGPPGVGKTHLVVAMAGQAIVERISVYFITIQDLVADLRKAWDENRFATRLGMYVRPRLLCIDEVGYLPLSSLEANLFFRLVAARYERGSLALTSNKGFVDWGQVFGDPVLATAILDRLVHHSTILNIRGDSYRLREKRTAGLLGEAAARPSLEASLPGGTVPS